MGPTCLLYIDASLSCLLIVLPLKDSGYRRKYFVLNSSVLEECHILARRKKLLNIFGLPLFLSINMSMIN
jgi:hypothetical protein